MCNNSIDCLLDEFEEDINKPNFNINDMCERLNHYGLTDDNLYRIATILFNGRKWLWLFVVLLFVLIYLVVISSILALGFVAVFTVLSFILPFSISITLTLITLMVMTTSIQCK